MFSLNVPIPGLDSKTVKELKTLLSAYEKASSKGTIVRGGVISEGDAAAYALVWEWGNARQTKEGPKTVLGMNPDGEQVWLSIQAPFGYIRIHEPSFVEIIQRELNEIDLSDVASDKDILKEIKKASSRAAAKIAELIRETAPVDSGDLRESIQPADPNDPDLAEDDNELELGTTHFTHAVREMLKKLKKR